MSKVKEPTTQYTAARRMETSELLLKEIQKLPEDALHEILDFIHSLKNKVEKQKGVHVRKFLCGKDLARSEIVGLWRKRKITDSVTYARKLRTRAEVRTR